MPIDDVDRAGFHRADELGRAQRRPDRVGRDDRGARFREQLGDLIGDPLDARAAGDEAVLLAAFGAGLGRRHHMAAMMAGEPVHQPVLDHPGGAVGALEAVAAVAAQGQRREAAAVEEQQRLLAALEVRFELIDERRRKPASARRRILRQVDRADLGQARSGEALRQAHFAIAADLDHVPALDRRRRRRQDHRNILELARITAVSRAWYWTPSSCLKLGSCASSTTISPRFGIGEEQGRARADRDLRFAACDAAPVRAAAATSAGPNATRRERSRSAPRSA